MAAICNKLKAMHFSKCIKYLTNNVCVKLQSNCWNFFMVSAKMQKSPNPNRKRKLFFIDFDNVYVKSKLTYKTTAKSKTLYP